MTATALMQRMAFWLLREPATAGFHCVPLKVETRVEFMEVKYSLQPPSSKCRGAGHTANSAFSHILTHEEEWTWDRSGRRTGRSLFSFFFFKKEKQKQGWPDTVSILLLTVPTDPYKHTHTHTHTNKHTHTIIFKHKRNCSSLPPPSLTVEQVQLVSLRADLE